MHLDQDGLDLWLAALRNATGLRAASPGAPGLMDLAPSALQLLADNLDLLGTIVCILEGYLLIDAATLLQVWSPSHCYIKSPNRCHFHQAYATELHQAIVQCLRQAIATNAKDLLVCIETMILRTPTNLWAKAMFDSGLFKQMLDTIIAGKVLLSTHACGNHILLNVNIGLGRCEQRIYPRSCASDLFRSEHILPDAGGGSV